MFIGVRQQKSCCKFRKQHHSPKRFQAFWILSWKFPEFFCPAVRSVTLKLPNVTVHSWPGRWGWFLNGEMEIWSTSPRNGWFVFVHPAKNLQKKGLNLTDLISEDLFWMVHLNTNGIISTWFRSDLRGSRGSTINSLVIGCHLCWDPHTLK